MIDFTKPVQFNGRPARIICTDRVGRNPIVALIKNDNGSESLLSFCPNGEKPFGKLENVPEKITVWMNIYRGYNISWPTREEADAPADSNRIACIPVTYFFGEGL